MATRTLKYDKDRNLIAQMITGGLDKRIFGQSRAVERLAQQIQIAFSPLKDPRKPLCVIMFAGPSRVGKTQIAYDLAEVLKKSRVNWFRKNQEDWNDGFRRITQKTGNDISHSEDVFSDLGSYLGSRYDLSKDENRGLLEKTIKESHERSGIKLSPEEFNKLVSTNKSMLGSLKTLFDKSLSSTHEKKLVELMEASYGGLVSLKKREVGGGITLQNIDEAYPSLTRIDCGTLKSPHDVSSLTGSPPGYIGSDRPALLDPGKINGNFGHIVLFDELEKAHPDIFDIFLQIFDYGLLPLKNARGVVDFRNAVIIMTSNIRSKEMEHLATGKGSAKIGFGIGQNFHKTDMDSLIDEKSDAAYDVCKEGYESTFSRPLRNRINASGGMIAFRYLDKLALEKIFDAQIQVLRDRNAQTKNPFKITVKEEVRDYIIREMHFEEQADGVISLTNRKIVSPLSACVNQGDVRAGDEVIVSLEVIEGEEEIVFTVNDKEKEDDVLHEKVAKLATISE